MTSVKPPQVSGQYVHADYGKAKAMSAFQIYQQVSQVCKKEGKNTDTVEFIRGKTNDARELGFWGRIKETLRLYTKVKLKNGFDLIMKKLGELKDAIKEAVGMDVDKVKEQLNFKELIDQESQSQMSTVHGLVEGALKDLGPAEGGEDSESPEEPKSA